MNTPVGDSAFLSELELKALRRAMASAHPDRGGTAEQFIEAHRRCQTALRPRLRAA